MINIGIKITNDNNSTILIEKMKIYLVLGSVLMLVALAACQTEDYCNKELCKKGTAAEGYYYVKHIGCNNNGGFSLACPRDRSLVPMTKDLVDLILRLHNEYRRKVATGNIPGYSKSNQMIEMSWNSQLAKLAEFNVKTCKLAHDSCRNSVQFRRTGQNLGITKTTSNVYPNPKNIIQNHTVEWFIEYKLCDMSYIQSFRTSNLLIGHFTQMVVDGADRIGCAMSKYDDGRRNVLFACNYSFGNLKTRPVYVTGQPCSKCKSGCSTTYPGLCNTNEKNFWTKDERDREVAGRD